MNKCRNWDMTLELKRFYISKEDGKVIPKGRKIGKEERVRPIGAPN